MPKPRWEQLLRLRVLSAPRHSSANDSARSLLIAAGVVAAVCLSLCIVCTRPLQWALIAFGVVFSGLSLQQYAWYTVRVDSECWEDEGRPVVMIVAFSSALLAVMNVLATALLPGWLQQLLQAGFALGILTCHRWAPWGSLFDGTDKLDARRRR